MERNQNLALLPVSLVFFVEGVVGGLLQMGKTEEKAPGRKMPSKRLPLVSALN